jgi:PBP1b-binding outer membrane lipoprotein LpoB
MAIVDNWNHYLSQFVEKTALKPFFKSVISGGEIGIRKPDKKIFQLALSKMKAGSKETIYIGNRYIDDVKDVIKNLYEDRTISGLIAQTQYELSIRQAEAFELIKNPNKYIENGRVENLIGKGNHSYDSKEISFELEQKLLNNQKQLISKSTYYEDLKKYNISSHDFRFTSARDKFEEKINSGISEKEAKLQISSELNHKREEITDYYLNRTQ